MAEGFFDGLPLFRWTGLRTRRAAGPLPRQAPNLFDGGDPASLRNEAVVTLNELPDLGVFRRRCLPGARGCRHAGSSAITCPGVVASRCRPHTRATPGGARS